MNTVLENTIGMKNIGMTHCNDNASENRIKKVVIVGLPNSGKSQVFNRLTGEYNIVANYPHTTVESRRAKCMICNIDCEIIDTPGLDSLYIHSEEELEVRELLYNEMPDVILLCIEAAKLRQTLTLAIDLVELQIPMVICLNAIDETSRNGIWIDSSAISRYFGVPVVETIALKGKGIQELCDAVFAARKGLVNIRYGETLESALSAIETLLPAGTLFRRKTSMLLLMHDAYMLRHLENFHGKEMCEIFQNSTIRFLKGFNGSPSRFISEKRCRLVDDIYSKSVKRQKLVQDQFLLSFSDLCRHPVYGIPIFLTILVLAFLIIAHVPLYIVQFLDALIVNPITGLLTALVPHGLFKEFLIGDYGILTLGLFNALCTVLPILSVFFFMFAILEDTGYMPYLSVLTNRVFKKIGLTSQAALPLMLGLGCKTMATLVTRCLSSRKEKIITVFLIAFALPCSAQLAMSIGLLSKAGFSAFCIAFGTLAIVEVAAGFALNHLIRENVKSEFIQQLPTMRIPSLVSATEKTWHRLVEFLKEAVPLFIVSAVALFLLDATGVLDAIKHILSPVVTSWLGLPIDIVDALILMIARHEAATGFLLNMANAGSLSYSQTIVSVILVTLFIPCFANIMAMCKEVGVKTAIAMVVAIMSTTLMLAVALNAVLGLIFGSITL